MKFKMKLKRDAFDRMKRGEKIVELRLYDEKRRKLEVGDEIEFLKLPDLKESIQTEVKGLLMYENFKDLIEDLPAKHLGFKEKDKEWLLESMYEIYDEEEEDKWGAAGIRVELI